MTRIVRRATIPPRAHIGFELIIGPAMGDFAYEQLELAWRAYGEEIMADLPAGPGLYRERAPGPIGSSS